MDDVTPQGSDRALLLALLDTRPEPGFSDELTTVGQLHGLSPNGWSADLETVIAVRDDLVRILLGPREGASEALSELGRRWGLTLAFGANGGVSLRLSEAGPSAPLLEPVVAAAVELWSAGDLDKLRVCRSSTCIVPFVDTSPRGHREFCSPRCATRERVHRHRAAARQ
ncbi:CGNR zinc finger domain-containing protein [Microbacterium sp. Leaf203]|uniref:CGNR zinc finger domain-containing protein n=1 Tax=Microbacterium sp. Leaf203 TaxID=1735677 RepID=UPI0006FF6DC6|nr:CGNR zinc finger domain-containing protein [Microbacterium sp. Leaf203]